MNLVLASLVMLDNELGVGKTMNLVLACLVMLDNESRDVKVSESVILFFQYVNSLHYII